MSKTNYTLSSKVRPDGKSQILVRFIASKNEIYRAKTGIWINADNWDKRNNKPKASRRDQEDYSECRHVQAKMDSLSLFVAERHVEDRHDGGDWLTRLVAGIRWNGDAVVNARLKGLAACDASESCRTMAKDDLANRVYSEATSKCYEDLADKIELFEAEDGAFMVGEFDAARLERFLNHCRAKYGLSDNTMSQLRVKVLRWHRWCADRDTSVRRLPSAAGRVRSKTYGTPYYLTKEQRDTLYKAPMPNAKVEKVRDAFILQCLLGCRVSDLLTLTKDNIKKGERIEYIATKTIHSNPQTISVPLHKTAREIIEKYSGCSGLVDVKDNSKTYRNRLRKAIAVSGIDCLVTVRDCHTGCEKHAMLSEVASSHMARRTFIGCLYEAGFRESDICSMSGHKEGSLSIQRYRKVSDERKRLMIDSI